MNLSSIGQLNGVGGLLGTSNINGNESILKRLLQSLSHSGCSGCGGGCCGGGCCGGGGCSHCAQNALSRTSGVIGH